MFGGKANDQLPERGRLGADAQHVVDNGAVTLVSGFRTDRISRGPDGATLVAVDGREAGPFDRIVNATGFRPDLDIAVRAARRRRPRPAERPHAWLR